MKKKIIGWIRQKVKESGAEGVIVGLSGGIDSSVTAVLCKEAFPDDILGLIMPCDSSPDDRKDAEDLAKTFDIDYKVVDLSKTYDTITAALDEGDKISMANIKPRLRMTVLYYYANLKRYLVVGTDNKSELLLGYFTKYGDGGVDILPIADLYKRDVRRLAKELGIAKEIIDRKPSAGLWEGQSDEDEIGLSYEEIDDILEKGIDDKKVKEMVKNSEHKRKLPPICKL
jgi:NAD+ synthase